MHLLIKPPQKKSISFDYCNLESATVELGRGGSIVDDAKMNTVALMRFDESTLASTSWPLV